MVIDNVVCLGACFSYSVPRAQDYEPIAPYCDKCDKTVTSWTVVTLNCTNETNGEVYQLPRNVELIQNCSCVDCNDNSIRQHVESVEEGIDTVEEDDDLPDTIEGNDLHGSHRHKNPDDILRGIPSKRDSLNLPELSNADIERMIQENKIPSDDDHDQSDTARRERQRLANSAAEHDL
jgi:neuroblastoma suppressor of tumorigenicity 1